MKLLLFILISLISLGLVAQPGKVDSLEQALNGTVGKEKAALYERLAEALAYQNPEKSIEYGTRSLEIGESLDDEEIKGYALFRIGNGFWSKGDLSIALDYLNSALNVALRYDFKKLEALVYSGFGNVYTMAGERVTANSYYREALSIFIKMGLQDRIIAVYNNLGKTFHELGEYDSANYYLSSALNELPSEYEHWLPIIQFNIAELRFKEQNLMESESILKKTAKIAEDNNDLRSQIRITQLLGEIALLNKDFDKAELFASQSVNGAEQTNVKELLYISYKTYAKALAAQKRFEEGYKYLNLANEYQDSVQSEQLVSRLKVAEYEKKNNKIEYLETEKQLISDSKRKQSYFIYALSVVVFLASVLAWIYYNSRKRIALANQNLASKNREIELRKSEIQKKANELDEVNQLKNKIISIISHDMKGPLVALHNTVELVNMKAMEPEDLQEIVPELTEKIKSTNNLLNNLVAWAKGMIMGGQNEMNEIALSELIQQELEILSFDIKRKKISVKNGVPKDFRLYSNKNILAIAIRNILSNAVKFSFENGEIRIALEQGEDGFSVLKIQDNGTGMTKEKQDLLFRNTEVNAKGTTGESGSGLGLILVKDLINLVGGDLKIDSEENKGTLTIIRLPNS